MTMNKIDNIITEENVSGDYSLLKHTEEHLVRPRTVTTREPHLYPSEASVKITHPDGTEEVLGTCMRAAYLRFTGEERESPNARSQFIFAMGHMVEDVFLEQWKQMGVWVDDDVEFYNNNYNIKGKLDAICKNPDGEKYGVEVKSFYGYFAQTQIIGNRSVTGKPKESQLLQTVVYANEFKNQLPYFKMIYLERGNAARTEFKIEVRPVEGTDRVVVNGNVETRYTIQDIYDRYSLLTEHITNRDVPPSEFKLYYDDNEIERFYSKGRVSKTNYQKFKRNSKNPNNRPGDWQCSYCPYKKFCWSA